ncbi:hypothetical protein C7T94_09205 [Pedobacter yulinensis]|uniref:Uncharacterized protein n=1 Tax=Pedobacter yulinensis TaxID=2126353 RepID=A0A2T3HK59_9SPHI|nr:hypothetical protein [Pedobacter yulinensis]PST82810.1 hypothetical protein C7T94_09205 [Pedobacter yulinensis]
MENSEKSGQPGKQPVGRQADDLRTDDGHIRDGARDENSIRQMQENAKKTRSDEQARQSGSGEEDRSDKSFGLGDSSAIDNGEKNTDQDS